MAADLVSLVVLMACVAPSLPKVSVVATNAVLELVFARFPQACEPGEESFERLRADVAATPPELLREVVYDLLREFAIARSERARLVWDEAVALFLDKAEPNGRSYVPSEAGRETIRASDAAAWSAIAVGLVTAAVAERDLLLLLRIRQHDDLPTFRRGPLPTYVRDRLVFASAEGEAAVVAFARDVVLDVLANGNAAQREELVRALEHGGIAPGGGSA